MNIGLLVGGDSPERDVSLSSGKAILKALESLGNNVIVLDPKDGIHLLEDQIVAVDLIFNALHGGDGENGNIAAYLESLGVLFTGSGKDSSRNCMDKNISKKIVSENEINTPKWVLKQTLPSDDIIKDIGFPMVVKPNDLGSTIGLSVAKNYKELSGAYDSALEFTDSIMFESFIQGREITVPIIGERSFPVVEIIPKNDLYDYECKYTAGMSDYICPANIDIDLSDHIKSEALKIHKLLNCDHYSRVDFLLGDKDKLWFLEINTLPGMTETSLLPKSLKADGYSFSDVIQMILDEATNNS